MQLRPTTPSASTSEPESVPAGHHLSSSNEGCTPLWSNSYVPSSSKHRSEGGRLAAHLCKQTTRGIAAEGGQRCYECRMGDLSFWRVGSMHVLGGRMVLVEGQPRERLEARWQIMMFAAGRVAPAMRERHFFRTNDRSRPRARRTSSGRARGSRASNKLCPRTPLLFLAPNERNRVDARALGRECF